jgi:hypothetical protein
MSIINAEELKAKMLKRAEQEISHCTMRVIEQKIDTDFNPSDWNKALLKTCMENLAQAENRLKVFHEKFAQYETEKPEIVKWALQ